MSDENKPLQVEAVREPLDAGRTELAAAAVDQADSPVDAEAAPGSGALDLERSPLGAYRRGRTRVADRSDETGETVGESQGSQAGDQSSPSEAPPATGSVESAPPAAPAHAAAAHSDALPDEAPSAKPHEGEQHAPSNRPIGSIEVPPPVQQLDAALVAEIDAAMASSELAEVESVSSSAVEGEEGLPEKPPEELLESGQHLAGKIQSIHGDGVLLDLGYRSPGVVPLRQFVSGKKPEVGQRIEVLVDRIAAEEGLIYLNLPKGLRRIAGNWDSLSKGQIVDCLVNRTNKGGLEVTVSGLRAFLPSSQVELGFVSELDQYIGQKLRVEVVEVNAKKRNLVVSRRAYLQIERKEAEGAFWQTAQVGQTFTGKVKTIKDYGVFVDLGSVDGFLHIGEMSWHRIKHPSELVKDGQTVDVKVLSLDPEKKKIGLGMKQLAQNPWTTAADKYAANTVVTGKVTRIADFGAFVELEPGLEGLIHVSELEHKHVRHASDVVKPNQVVTAQVLELDPERKRVSLSLKALQAKPEAPKPVEEPPVEAYQRKRKGPLRGGTGSTGPGGLFGNPSDFR
ncbi:MAG TPA: S1 RNA-binding domain-containing protein [Planctomycetaceae bacterium]|jgi:small subunit ribosomal protein S1|nr:S1 RNA-binding domain-containing protein [Planctomycetaceae bacterium]